MPSTSARTTVRLLSTMGLLLLLARPSLGDGDGEFLYQNLEKNGFKCREAGDKSGEICRVNSVHSGGFNYSQPVVMLIPNKVRRPNQIILHLHGFRENIRRDRTVDAMLNDFNFLQQMHKAGVKNSVLVFPVSTGQCTTFNRELVPRFAKFARWVRKNVNPTNDPKNDHWIMTAHSGAYRPLAAILRGQIRSHGDVLPHLRGVSLFDATYGNSSFDTSVYKRAREINPNLKIFSVYRAYQGGAKWKTTLGSQKLRRDLNLGQNVFPDEEKQYGSHWDMVRVNYSNLLAKMSDPGTTYTPVTGTK